MCAKTIFNTMIHLRINLTQYLKLNVVHRVKKTAFYPKFNITEAKWNRESEEYTAVTDRTRRMPFGGQDSSEANRPSSSSSSSSCKTGWKSWRIFAAKRPVLRRRKRHRRERRQIQIRIFETEVSRVRPKKKQDCPPCEFDIFPKRPPVNL